MTDREQAGLRGPVKACAVEADYVYPDRRRAMHTITTFSTVGDLLEQRHRNPDGSEWSIVCSYDNLGRISQKERQSPEAKQVFSYRYDALGRLERVVERTDGTDRVCESYHYDLTGNKTATVYPDPTLRDKGNIGVDVEAAFEISVEASSILTIFDEQGRPVKRVFYDPNGTVERRILIRYDAAGHLVEEGEREADGSIREDLRHVYRYDAEGRLIEKIMYLYAFGTHRKMFVYNQHGDVVEEGHQRTAGIVDPGGGGDWNVRYRYRYDSRGNWIERVAETVLPTGEQRMSMVERRRIDYY